MAWAAVMDLLEPPDKSGVTGVYCAHIVRLPRSGFRRAKGHDGELSRAVRTARNIAAHLRFKCALLRRRQNDT